MLRIIFIITAGFLLLYSVSSSESRDIIREDFNTLDSWKPLKFPKIKNLSVYSLAKEEDNSILRCEADASASGLLYIHSFKVNEFPFLKWRWKIINVYKKGDAAKKEGDDYPARIYIIFKYDPSKASFFEKVKYNAAKLLYGEFPPHSSLNYIWANREHGKKIISNAYTEKNKMIIMEIGQDRAGAWITESANILNDYKEAFGEFPPAEAGLAVMCDADNTGEKAVSFIDYIELSGQDK